MGCIPFDNGKVRGFICGVPSTFRLPLEDGTRIYMEWQSYHGPTFFKDKNCTKMLDTWYENPMICKALDWFIKRGNIA